jgi:hypothetical protein
MPGLSHQRTVYQSPIPNRQCLSPAVTVQCATVQFLIRKCLSPAVIMQRVSAESCTVQCLDPDVNVQCATVRRNSLCIKICSCSHLHLFQTLKTTWPLHVSGVPRDKGKERDCPCHQLSSRCANRFQKQGSDDRVAWRPSHARTAAADSEFKFLFWLLSLS